MSDTEYEVHIEPEFQELVYPLSTRAYQALEESFLQGNNKKTIKVWNHQVLDGQSIFEICARNGIPFSIEKKHFKRRKDAVAWICEQQLQRNDLPPHMRRYLIGMLYETQKPASGRGRTPIGKAPGTQKVRREQLIKRLSEKNRVTTYTVERYGAFARAINSIRKSAPKLAQMILSDEYGITHEKAVQLSHQSKFELLLFQASLTKEDAPEAKKVQSMKSLSVIGKTAPSVKDDPVFDPDAEINGLALTIPSWCSSMERVRNSIDPEIVSEKAKSRLRSGLLMLMCEVEKVEEFVS